MIRHLKRGWDIPLEGIPEQKISGRRSVSRVALLGPDYGGMRPSMGVREGEEGQDRGSPL